jgi:ubiquinone/menaquinone biosynthesis C-methylase UbiE
MALSCQKCQLIGKLTLPARQERTMPLSRILEIEVMDTPEEALDYDAMDHSAVNRVFVDDLLAAIQETGASSQESGFLDFLDLGTGTALIPIELCKSFKHCRVMACDAASHMLDQARYNLAAHDFNDRIELHQVDAKALPFQETKFDVVMSNSIIHHIPEPLAVLREAVRVTRPGGLLFFRDLLRPESKEQLNHLVETYAAGANDHQRQMFADSLHAALLLDQIRDLVASLNFPRESVQQTTDRHWTWVAKQPAA